jgi:hypothetical protein
MLATFPCREPARSHVANPSRTKPWGIKPKENEPKSGLAEKIIGNALWIWAGAKIRWLQLGQKFVSFRVHSWFK